MTIFNKWSALDPALEREQIQNSGSGGGGLALISQGKITTPVAFLDVALPDGYVQFILNVSGIQYSQSGNTMGVGVSVDGGATFINDTGNGDSYFEQGMTSAGADVNVLTTNNPLMDINQGAQGVGQQPAHSLIFDVFPGSDIELFYVIYRTFARNNTFFYAEFGAQGLNPLATITPTPNRVNVMRLLPYGNGDIPPTSGATITSGAWSVFGIPSS